MNNCPNCGAQIKDDSLFCTECGKPIPQGCVCPHCGASINEGDAFCQNCGKSINDEKGLTSNDDKQQALEENSSSNKRSIILGVFAAVLIGGGLLYCSSSKEGENPTTMVTNTEQNTSEVLVSDSIEEAVDSVMLDEELSTDSVYADEQDEVEDYDWLQGHWVYDVDVSTDRSYRIHVVIEGNRIVQYKNNRSESPNPTFTIEDGKIHAPYYKDMETTYLIDPVKKSIDLGDGWRWMYKLGSDEEIRHRVGFETENTFFIKIANQSFRNQEGKEIRFDENRKVYFNDVYAGTLSIVKLEKTKAIVNYNGGEFGEGKFDVHTNLMTTNFLMIDKPSDGVFTKIRNTD